MDEAPYAPPVKASSGVRAKAIANTQASSRSRTAADAAWKARPRSPDASEGILPIGRGLGAGAAASAGLDPSGVDEPKVRAKARRQEIERALVAHGILHITRRAIPLRIRSRPWEKNGYGLHDQAFRLSVCRKGHVCGGSFEPLIM